MQNMSGWNDKPTARWRRRFLGNSDSNTEVFVTLRKGTDGQPSGQPDKMRSNPSRDRVAFAPSVGGALFHRLGALPQIENKRANGD